MKLTFPRDEVVYWEDVMSNPTTTASAPKQSAITSIEAAQAALVQLLQTNPTGTAGHSIVTDAIASTATAIVQIKSEAVK